MIKYRAFDEAIDFITSLPEAKEVLAYTPSSASVRRLELLLEKNGKII